MSARKEQGQGGLDHSAPFHSFPPRSRAKDRPVHGDGKRSEHRECRRAGADQHKCGEQRDHDCAFVFDAMNAPAAVKPAMPAKPNTAARRMKSIAAINKSLLGWG
jgi:hypothetical protein